MMIKQLNKHKLVFGSELANKLMALGYMPVRVEPDRTDNHDFIYRFVNSYELRQVIRAIVNN